MKSIALSLSPKSGSTMRTRSLPMISAAESFFW